MQPHQHQLPTDVLPVINAYMGNIAVVVTTNHARIYALVASNARLTATTEKQHATIKSLQKENGTLRERGKSGGGGGGWCQHHQQHRTVIIGPREASYFSPQQGVVRQSFMLNAWSRCQPRPLHCNLHSPT